MGKKTSAMKDMIRDSIDELRHGDFPDDPKLDLQQMSGPERFENNQKRKDEVVIDSLLSDISGKTGYFLKLKKEVRPNEYMLMKVIESDWRKWADIEVAVSEIVKEHTKTNHVKWGSGAYRVEVACKGGMRGKGYSPIDFYINAEEEFMTPQLNGQNAQQLVNPDVAVASRIEELSNLVNMLSGVFPKPQDPNVLQQQISQAFQQGMQQKSNDASNTTQMMTAMMTGLIGMMTTVMQGKQNSEPKIVNPEDSMRNMLTVMKDFGALGNRETPKEKTVVDFAKELQLLGIDLFKKDDPAEQINKLKQIAGLASQFIGMGGEGAEKPSILERVIDVLGPAVPKMISDFKEATANAARTQMIAGQNIRAAIPTAQNNSSEAPTVVPTTVNVGEQTTYQKMSGGQIPIQTEGRKEPVNTVPGTQEQTEQIKTFFAQLYESVENNNRMFYPVIYTSLLQDQQGVQLIQGIAQGTQNAKHLIDMLQQHGDERFRVSQFVMKSLVPYVNGFIVWIQQMAGINRESLQSVDTKTEMVSRKMREFDVTCNVCRTEFTYPSEAEFLTDTEKNCGEEGCTGSLEPSMRAVS